MLTVQRNGLGAAAEPCDAIADATVRQACKVAWAGQGPNAVAQFFAAKGGAAACTAVGLGVLAPYCSQAAAAIAAWVQAGYTPHDRADILYRAANGQQGAFLQLGVYGGLMGGPGPNTFSTSYEPWKSARANVRANLQLLGFGNSWEKPKDAGVDLILLGMITKGVAGKTISWWAGKRTAADLSPLPTTVPIAPIITSGVVFTPGAGLTKYGPNAITTKKWGKWHIAIPRGTSLKGVGFGDAALGASPTHQEVATEEAQPAGVPVVTKQDYENKTKPWYLRTLTLGVGTAALVAAGVGVWALARRRA